MKRALLVAGVLAEIVIVIGLGIVAVYCLATPC